ncbi:hypothetical protein QFC20_007607 [Naganishia adeliensis]|uniref:Uncharacterized protein n=1 Tax=Naganishia adeliensis TaxID=92952 RepID=A0ACC2UX96_9TREE|nr:hypothetical protein QFC20_007607 [Naganishia adeliensis]
MGVDIAVGNTNRVKNKGKAPIIDLLNTTSDDPIIVGLMADREMLPDTLEEFNRQTTITSKTTASKMMKDPKVGALLRDRELFLDSLEERQRWINDNPLAQEEAAEEENLRASGATGSAPLPKRKRVYGPDLSEIDAWYLDKAAKNVQTLSKTWNNL